MGEEPTFICPSCHSKMIRLEWNNRVDIMVCNNSSCPLWHTTGPSVPRRGTTLAEDPAPLARKRRGSKVKHIPPEEFTDDQEVSLTSKELLGLRRKLLAQKEDTEIL